MVTEDYARVIKSRGSKETKSACGAAFGMKTTYGMARQGLAYEPATRPVAGRIDMVNGKVSRFTRKLFDAVRNTFGFNEHLLR